MKFASPNIRLTADLYPSLTAALFVVIALWLDDQATIALWLDDQLGGSLPFIFCPVKRILRTGSNWIQSKGFTVWFTGLPGSGKSTVSHALYEAFLNLGLKRCELLDGDVVRTHISKGLGFSRTDRDTNILRIGWVAQLLTKHGIPNIVAAISPYRETRKQVRAMVTDGAQPDSFVEVFVKCPLEECMRRDPKGLYKAARKGEVKWVTGVDDPYEEPEDPEIVLDTTVLDVVSEVDILLQYLQSRGLILPGEYFTP